MDKNSYQLAKEKRNRDVLFRVIKWVSTIGNHPRIYLKILCNGEYILALSDVLARFNEPTRIKCNRCDDWRENACTSHEVYTKHFSKTGLLLDWLDDVDLEWLYKHSYYEWSDIIKLWTEDFSSGEKFSIQEKI